MNDRDDYMLNGEDEELEALLDDLESARDELARARPLDLVTIGYRQAQVGDLEKKVAAARQMKGK